MFEMVVSWSTSCVAMSAGGEMLMPGPKGCSRAVGRPADPYLASLVSGDNPQEYVAADGLSSISSLQSYRQQSFDMIAIIGMLGKQSGQWSE